MWKVAFTDKAEKEIKSLLKQGLLTNDDRNVISIWIKQVKKHGPDSLWRKNNIWNDHALTKEWEGHRSSSYSFSGRIIYKIEKNRILVVVVRITPHHDYSKED